MKRKILKGWALTLSAALMAATLTACGGSGKDSGKSASNDDTFTITCVTADFGNNPKDTEIQAEWLRKCEEYMGKKVDIKFEYIGWGDYKEKLQVLIAGGDLPDLLTFARLPAADVIKYGEKGIFADFTPHLDKMPNYKAALDKDPNVKTSLYSNSGKLYGLYNAIYSPVPTTTLTGASAVRSSVLKENDLEIPSTLDEMYDVALALKEKGVSEYPIAVHEEWMPLENTIFSAYHSTTTLGGRLFDGEKYIYSPITEDYRDALKYLNKIYTAGLVAPDYFSHTADNGSKALSDGSAVIFPNVWDNYPAQWAVDYPEEEWVVVPQMSSDKYPDNPWMFFNETEHEWELSSGYSIVVNEKSKNKEEIFKFLDYQLSPEIVELLNWGVKDKHFVEKEDGTKEFLLTGQSNRDTLIGTGLPLSGSCRAGIFPQPQDFELWRVANTDISPISWEGEIINQQLVPFCSEKITDQTTSPVEYEPVLNITSDENETYSNIMSPIDTYVKEQRVKFIKGERSFDEWDKYVKEVKKMGDIDAAMDIRNSKIK